MPRTGTCEICGRQRRYRIGVRWVEHECQPESLAILKREVEETAARLFPLYLLACVNPEGLLAAWNGIK